MIAAWKQRVADPQFHFLAAVIFVVFATVVHMMSLPLIVSWDGMQYVHLAEVLSRPAVISHWEFYRTPLFPLALNMAFRLCGEQPQSALLVTNVFGLSGIVLTGLIVRRVAGATAGAITLVVLALYPILIGYEHMLLTETGIFFWMALLLWSLICLAPASRRMPIAMGCWTAVVIALGYYWRPTVLYLSPLAAMAFLLPFRRGNQRLLTGALVVALGPWLLSYPWRHLTQKYKPGSYAEFCGYGMFKEVLVPPDNALLAPVREDYTAAIRRDLVNGHLRLDGVSIGENQALAKKMAAIFANAGIGRLIRTYALRYIAKVAKAMLFFLGVPGGTSDDENGNFSHAVFTLWPPPDSLNQMIGWDAKWVQFNPQPYRGGAAIGKLLDMLRPVYTCLVLASSVLSLLWLAVSIKQADPVGLTLTAIPLALLFLHALTLQAADRYAAPVYPIMLANGVIVIRSCARFLSRSRH